MNCHLACDLCSAYIDNELPPKERELVEDHLKACASCHEVYEDLQRIVNETKSLPFLEPRPTLWAQVKAGISQEPRRKFRSFRALNRLESLWIFQKSPALACAMVVLILIIVATFWTWKPGLKEKRAEDMALAEIKQAELHYQKAISSLNQIVVNRKSSWDPEFLEIFEANLKKIDRAIADCEEAIKKSPADPEAASFLLAAYAYKVDFLQQILQMRS